ncbi:DUF1566 domain-containing protein [bacterium]|nr:DUF1566 domain-containing protein [bacterium]
MQLVRFIASLIVMILPTWALAYDALTRPTELQYWDQSRAFNGYTFFGVSGTTYLIDMQGRVVHTWPIGTNPHLLDNGHVLDASKDDPSGFGGFTEVDWDGNTSWQYTEARSTYHPHHDFTRIYNPKLGAYTTLYIANKDLTYAQLVAAGADPARTPSTGAQMDAVVEVDMSGNIVWEWCFFDHTVQNYDSSKANYVGTGKTIADYPGKLDINLTGHNLKDDWLHCNSLDYNQSLDQIVINSVQGEFYVIDHGNTFTAGNPTASIAAAATSAGDFLYRFGDPARYAQGTTPAILEDWTQSTHGTKQLGGAHHISWIGAGLSGAGHFMIFNNAQYLSEHTPQSEVFEINPYLNSSGVNTGNYVNPPDAGYNTITFPAVTDKTPKQQSKQIVWNYRSKNSSTLFSTIGCSGQRLPNGNTLVCADTYGYISEVTSDSQVVWEYIVPVAKSGIVQQTGDKLPMVISIFRAYRYGASHPAFSGRSLTPGNTIAGRSTVSNPYAGQSYQALQRETEVQYYDSVNSANGYTLFGAQNKTYLIDMQGRVVNTWAMGANPRLLENGHLLDAVTSGTSYTGFRELDWNGNTAWQYTETRSGYHPHGDFARIYDPKLGAWATIYIAAKDLTNAQCIAAGCDPADAPYIGAQADCIVEIDMNGNVIWEWCFFDHGIQNVDSSKSNYVGSGKTISDYPGRLNLNLPGRPIRSQWPSCNSLDYNQSLDQIVVNSEQGEFYIVNHGSTFIAGNPAASIAAAASSAGDFLYRFGDPARYLQGSAPSVTTNWENTTNGNKQIGASNNAHWIASGLTGAGHLMVFSNNQFLFQRTPQSYVFEINPYLNSSGTDTGAYVNPPSAGYSTWTFDKDTMKANQLLSRQVVWKYGTLSNLTLFSQFGSSAERLSNGNTLICAATTGYMLEVTSNSQVVWEYINPVTASGVVGAIGDCVPMTNAVWRAHRYPASFAGFMGKDMTPVRTITAEAASAWSMTALPDTGQTASFTGTFGEDADYTINPPSYTDNGNGTITDNVTGLMWQKADGGEMTFDAATTYSLSLVLGGHDDWRLPTAHELFSIMKQGTINPAMDSVFTASAAEYWWSRDTLASDATRVWSANAGGGIGPHPKSETISAGGSKRFHVRCVRGATAPVYSGPIHHFKDNGDGTVTDLDTNLMWQKGESPATKTWENALSYAEGLTLAGRGDWRLPNVKELQSLNDETLTEPSIDTAFFPGAQVDEYWSSTSMVNNSTLAWTADLQYGIVSYNDKTTALPVRCVRDVSATTTTAFVPSFAVIPGGSFSMGDHQGFVDPLHPTDELPLHAVTISAFYLCKTDVTCREYCDYLNAALAQGLIEVRSNYIYGVGGSEIYSDTYAADPASRINWDGSTFAVRDGRDLHPITGIRWLGAAAYCNWLSARDGYEPVYTLSTGAFDLTKTGYRLPTEAEWEYAGRGGLYNPYCMFPWGADLNSSGTLANWPGSGDPYETGADPHTTPVGFYNGELHAKADFGWPGAQTVYQTKDGANAYGLYDMSGNVWQWINDWYGRDYYQYCVDHSVTTNPPGPTSGDAMPDGKAYHGMRGGQWYNGQDMYGMGRVSNRDPGYYRGPGDPNGPWFHVGFRVARGGAPSSGSLPPAISGTTRTPSAPTPADAVWVNATITDDISVANANLTYWTGSGTETTSETAVFSETMCVTAVKPWTGLGADNAWTVTGNYIEQRTGSNYGSGNACGAQFHIGTSDLTASMIATTSGINAAGTAGYVEFWVQTNGLDSTDGWTFQIDSGSGFQTRLSELTGTSHAWQKFHYDLASNELVSGIKLRFQFRGGNADERIDLDQITVKVTTGSGGGSTATVPMYDDGAHGDGAAGDHVYGAQIPAFATGTTVHYYITAADGQSNQTVDPAAAPTTTYSYTVSSSSTTRTVGLFTNLSGAFAGYTLLAPMHYTRTYLIDNNGQYVHTWDSAYEPGRTAYLMPNGHLFRECMIKQGGPSTGGGEGGRIEEYDWDGNLVWEYDCYSSTYIAHHDFKVLPNGNVILLVAEKKTYAECIAAGFNPAILDTQISTSGYMLPDYVVEIQPVRPSGGTVVWQWHVWDHLIQDFDSSKNNYGVVANHPELIDANGTGQKIPQFWNHMNTISYNAGLDQIMMSARGNSEAWVIDHQTSTTVAAGHTGGRYNKGGDLLYRWGNPQQYGMGTSSNQMLFQQHDTEWIPDGRPGAGDILIFNNGIGRGYSTIDEITPPVDGSGNYSRTAGTAFGPSTLTWTYKAPNPSDFYSAEISGAQRLPNGNTLICEGLKGNLFEVTSAGAIVWRYVCPVTDSGPMTQGDAIPADPRGGFMNAVFQADRYGLDYAAFIGRDLTPRGNIEIGTVTTKNAATNWAAYQ